jgi:hypothetical protein
MAGDVEIRQGPEWAALSRRLKEAGNGELRKAVRNEITQAARPLGRYIAVSAAQRLPQRGGFGYRIAATPVRVAGSVVGDRIGAVITLGSRKTQVAQINDGNFRHPVWGNRKNWVVQDVTSGAFTRAFEQEAATAVALAIETGLRQVAAKIEKG